MFDEAHWCFIKVALFNALVRCPVYAVYVLAPSIFVPPPRANTARRLALCSPPGPYMSTSKTKLVYAHNPSHFFHGQHPARHHQRSRRGGSLANNSWGGSSSTNQGSRFGRRGGSFGNRGGSFGNRSSCNTDWGGSFGNRGGSFGNRGGSFGNRSSFITDWGGSSGHRKRGGSFAWRKGRPARRGR